MKNTIGENLQLTLFGESHGPAIGVVLDGLPAGFAIDMDRMHKDLDRRKAKGALSTRRHEEDEPHILSGVFENKTTGAPLTILIENKSMRSSDYAALKSRLRPGHADFAAFEKYDGFQDYRGGGHFSGRLTAPLVAAGSICMQILESFGVFVGTHILSLYDADDIPFEQSLPALSKQLKRLRQSTFPVLDDQAALHMMRRIEEASKELDSVGGILQTAVVGLPSGIGEPFFDSVESRLSHLLFSIPALKAVSFGAGFDFAKMKGSQANDALWADETGAIQTLTNHNGGINGGITNGMPLVFQTCIKPTPSIYLPQQSADYLTRENVILEIKGRHDPAIIHRACIVQDALCAFGLLDLWMARQGVAAFQRRSLS